MPRATLMHLSCSPNYVHASYLDEHTLMYEPIVNSNMSSVNLFNMKMNEINCSDDFFYFTMNTILFTFHVDFVENQVVSVFIHNILVNENLAYSFS